MAEPLENEYDEELELIETKETEEDNNEELPPTDIVAFNELRSCADLLRMHETGQLVIKPDFQRDIVWNKPAQTRFIDSLKKQLPIPSMCISFDYKTNERYVIDGLQRISSIINFLSDKTWTLSNLDDVDPKLSGKSVSAIKSKNPEVFNSIENLTIPITVIRCDYSKKSHNEYLFTIFHRLNTGGTKLNNQEIRNCIYGGSLNEFLKEQVKYPNFRKLLKLTEDKTYRFIYEELVLRFFAFFDGYQQYKGMLSSYLNNYMQKNRNLTEAELENKKQLFKQTIDFIYIKILNNEALPQLSKATLEGLFIGVSKNIDTLQTKEPLILKRIYTTFRKDPHYSVDSLKEGLSAKSKVILRLETAINIFSE